jgi:hypothetical protein
MSAFGQVAEPDRRRPFLTTVLVGLPFAGVLLGAVLALAFGGGDARTTPDPAAAAPVQAVVTVGDLRLTLPDGWTTSRKGPTVPGFEGARTSFLRSWNADVAAAMLPAQQPSLLPRRLDAATTSATAPTAKPRVARAGTVSGYEYVREAKGKRALDVVVVPTTQGIATIACESEVVAPGECSEALRGLRLTRGSILPLGPDSAFLARLPAVTSVLGAQRLRLRTRLTRAGLVAGAARTAYRLAGTYGAAARALRPLAAPHSEARSTFILLRRLRSRYFTLAAAIRSRSRPAFKAAARSIDTNEQRLAARIEAWQRALRSMPG